jgi:tetratricopeptide (TPR) repeat protein
MPKGESADLVGKRYELLDMLGQGGMGTVYRAYDRLTGQTVALKRVVALAEEMAEHSTAGDLDYRLALAQEFKTLASLRHPYIIEVLDYGFDDEQQPYFTMELLDSPDNLVLAGFDQPLEKQIEYLAQMLLALAYLHRRGVLHRDLKPENVLVVNGKIKVLDFGLAVTRDRSHVDEDSNVTVGTLAYIAPESIRGNPATERSDLYSVGMIAYELFAGVHPYEQRDVVSLVNHVLHTTPDTDSLGIDGKLAAVLRKMLEKDPKKRFADANEALIAIDKSTDFDIELETAATRESFLQAARFIGRDNELDQLLGALRQAKAGKGSAWLIAGESGVGKTRLVDELRTRAMVDGAFVIRGQSVSEGRSPYQMWRPILRWMGLLSELSSIEAGIVKLIVPDVVTLPESDVNAAAGLEPELAQDHLLKMLESVIRNQSRPLLMIMEDLHWSSSESMTMLSRLTDIVSDLPLLLVASYRDDERPYLPPSIAKLPTLRLERLSKKGIIELSEAMLGEAGKQPQVVDLLERETEGNVFFLIEVVRALAEEAGNLEQIGHMTLPEHVFAGGVQVIVQRRLDRIPEEYHNLLRVAAVIGRQIDLDLLRKIEPEADINMWLTACVNAAALETVDGEWRFAHDKLRDGVLEWLSADERKALHRQAAEAIEQVHGEKEQAAHLAYHWGIVGDIRKEDYYVSLAGEQALRSGAYREAATFFDRALSLVSPVTVDEMISQMRRVFLQHRKAEAHLGFGGYDAAYQLYRSSLVICEQMGDRVGTVRTFYALGEVRYATGDYERSRQYFQDSLRIYREMEDKSGIAKTLNSLGNIAYDMGDDDIAKRLYQQSLSIAREIGDQWGMAGSISTSEMEAISKDHAKHRQTREELLVALDAHTRQDNKARMAEINYQLADSALETKKYQDARERFVQALALYRELGDVSATIRTLIRLGNAELALDERNTAKEYLREALDTAIQISETTQTLRALVGLARLRMATEQKIQAMEFLAFVMNYPDAANEVEDEAEKLVFELEAELDQAVIEGAWERGKAYTLEKLVSEALS